MNDIIEMALRKCAKEFDNIDHYAWVEKKSYPSIALDLAVMLKHMGYEIVKSPAKEENNGE